MPFLEAARAVGRGAISPVWGIGEVKGPVWQSALRQQLDSLCRSVHCAWARFMPLAPESGGEACSESVGTPEWAACAMASCKGEAPRALSVGDLMMTSGCDACDARRLGWARREGDCAMAEGQKRTQHTTGHRRLRVDFKGQVALWFACRYKAGATNSRQGMAGKSALDKANGCPGLQASSCG